MTAAQSEIEKNLKFTPHNAPARFHGLSDSPQSTANSRDRKSSIEGMFSKFQETLILFVSVEMPATHRVAAENYRREKRSARATTPRLPVPKMGCITFPRCVT